MHFENYCKDYFIRIIGLLLIFTVITLMGESAWGIAEPVTIKQNGDQLQICNGLYTVTYGMDTGLFNMGNDTDVLFRDAYSNAELDSGGIYSNNSYKRSYSVQDLPVGYPAGKRVLILLQGLSGKPDLRLVLDVYEGNPFLCLSLEVVNNTTDAVKVKKIAPLSITPSSGGQVLPGNIASELMIRPSNGFDSSLYKVADNPDKNFRAMWEMLLYNLNKGVLFAGGFVSHTRYEGYLDLRYRKDSLLTLTAHCSSVPIRVNAGETLAGDTVALCLDKVANVFDRMYDYADLLRLYHNFHRSFDDVPVPTGWSSWYATDLDLNEDAIQRNLDFITNNLADYGYKLIQLDDGWEDHFYVPTRKRPLSIFGNWDANENMPHGMKWTANRIVAAGMWPGLWIAPYLVHEKSDVFQNHYDWLLPGTIGPIPLWDMGGFVDLSNPAVQTWFGGQFAKIRDWGYTYLKIDFTPNEMWGSRYHNPDWTGVDAYKKGWKLICQNSDPDVWVAGCGAGRGPVIGYLDSARVGEDIGWRWKTFTRAVSQVCTKYYQHRKLWINDPEYLILRPKSLSDNEARVWSTYEHLSGGNLISSDDLPTLPSERISYMKKIAPPYGQSAMPLDYLEHNLPRLWFLDLTQDPQFPHYQIAIFNWEDLPKDYQLRLDQLPIPPKKYIGFEFWNEEYVGKLNSSEPLNISLAPHAAKVIAFCPVAGTPAPISTNRHIAQGAVELRDVKFEQNALSGIFTGVANTKPTLYIYVPGNYVMSQVDVDTKYETNVSRNILAITFSLGQKTQIHWKVNFTP